jgi:hypothetical protein
MIVRHAPHGLAKIAAELDALDKAAARAPSVPITRAAGYGALAGLGMHGGRELLSATSGVPTDPNDTATGAAGKAAAGGAAIAGLLNLLNRISARR